MDRTWFASLILLPPVYTVAIILPLFPADAYGVWLGATLTIIIGLISVSTSKVVQEIAALLLIVLAFLAVAGLAGGGAFAAFGIGVADGALIGLPFVVGAYVWRAGEPVLNRIVAFQVTLLLVLMLLATRVAFVSAGAAVTEPSFISEFVSINTQQLNSLGALVQGLSYPGLPLSQFSDPVFLATGLLAFAGLLLVIVRPQTGRESELPTTPYSELERYRPAEATVQLLSWSQRELLDRRSRPAGPPDRWLPGVAPLLAAAIVTGLGLGLAFVIPTYFLLLTVVLILGFLFVFGWVLSGPRGPTPGPFSPSVAPEDRSAPVGFSSPPEAAEPGR